MKDYILGLDVGTSSVKWVLFAKKEDGLRLIKADFREIDSFTAAPEQVEKETLIALRDAAKDLDVKRSEVFVNLNCPRTAVRKILVPAMPPKELKEAIHLGSKSYFPFPTDGALVDFEILGETSEKEAGKLQTLIATSPASTVEERLLLLEKAGIRPTALVPVPCAFENLAGAQAVEEGRIKCFVDIGEVFTELVVFCVKRGIATPGKRPDLVFSRKIPVAGRDFTKALTLALTSDKGNVQLDLKEAEAFKREWGIPKSAAVISGAKISAAQAVSMMRMPLEQLAGEIERCFDYCREEAPESRIDSLVLFGGGGLLKGLAGFLSERLAISVKLGNPFEKLLSKHSPSPLPENLTQFAVAVGLALGTGHGINLIPEETRSGPERAIRRTVFEALAAGVATLLVLAAVGLFIQRDSTQKKIAGAKAELESLRPVVRQAEEQQFVSGLLAEEPYWDDLFKALSRRLPDNIRLTEISKHGRMLTLKGLVAFQGREEALSHFIAALGKDAFKGVKLVTTRELKGQEMNEFELACSADGGEHGPA